MSVEAPPVRVAVRAAILGMRCGFTEAVVSQMMMPLESVVGRHGVDPYVQAEPPKIEVVATVIAMPELGDHHRMGSAGGWSRTGDMAIVGSRSGLRDAAFRAWLEDFQLDAIVMACFPWKLPTWLCALPAFGCLNVHPSLLPDGRGAEPLFWAFRWSLEETGVTVHLVDGGWDTGPILAQQMVRIPPDATVPSLEHALAVIGGDLVREVLVSTLEGSLAMRPQVDSSARTAPNPTDHDLRIDTSWTAERAARFMRAVIPAYGPITVTVLATGQRCMIAEVIDLTSPAADEPPIRWHGEFLSIAFTGGRLKLRLVSSAGGEPVLLPFSSAFRR